jgi:3-deoxy-D-manno-octulosonic acid (KDO) 8-phosphate synthase
MNKTILSGTVRDPKRVNGLTNAGLHFTLRTNSIDGHNRPKEATTDIPCVILNPRNDIEKLLEKLPVIECEGKIIRFTIPAEDNRKISRVQVVVNQRTIAHAAR